MTYRRENVLFRSISIVGAIVVAGGLALPHAYGQDFLYNRAAFTVGHYASSVVAADFNHDQKLDLAVANSADNSISVVLGSNTFGPKRDYAVGNLPMDVVAADFNGDKNIDLAVVNTNSNSISILLGNGDGTFQMHTDYSTGNYPLAVVIADFNGDKNMDLAVVNENDSTVSILLGNGDGSFQARMDIPVDTTPTALGSGDFNGDHKTDLITSNVGNGTVTVLISHGNGTFTRLDSPSGASLTPFTSTLAVGDFNRDGKLDVVISSEFFSPNLLLGNGNGSFQAPSPIPNPSGLNIGAILAGKFNGDGLLDIACATPDGLTIIPGNGNGTFQQAISSPFGGAMSSLAVGDFNGDGKLDFSVTDSYLNTVDVLLGNGKGTFGGMSNVHVAPGPAGPAGAVVADFNGDGKLDLAVAEMNSPHGHLSIQLGKGNGTFATPKVSPLGSPNLGFMTNGDFNGDGKVDLLIRDSNGFEILLGNADGTFLAPVSTALAYTALSVTVGDLDGDGKSDVVVTTNGVPPAGPTLNIYLSNGDGTFRTGADYAVQFYSSVVAADMNHDGKADLIVKGTGVQVYLGNGDGTLKSPIAGPTGTFTSDMAIADFNDDGKLDLAVGTYSGLAFMAGNGDGTLKLPVYSNPAFSFTGRLVPGDATGDSKLDLFSTAPSDTSFAGPVVMVGNGDGTFQAPAGYGLPGAFGNPVVVGDFNSDGISDFAVPSIGGANGTLLSLYLSTPVPNLFPTTLNFGKQVVGTTSSSRTATVTNVGNAPLIATSVTISGDFHLVQSCVGKLAVDHSCSLDVTFRPTVIGKRTGTVTIKDNAGTKQQIVHLTGVGQ